MTCKNGGNKVKVGIPEEKHPAKRADMKRINRDLAAN
jgi:hypothetical protein